MNHSRAGPLRVVGKALQKTASCDVYKATWVMGDGSGLMRREQVRWNGVVDHSGEGGGDVVRGNVGCRKVLRVIGWNMCGV